MADPDTLSTDDVALGRQVKWLIGLRLLAALLFLGSAGILALREHPPFALTPLFVLSACACLLTVLYLLALSHTTRLRRFCSLQIWIDVVLVTALVHYTGGIDSFFSFVYIFPILAGAIFLSRRSSLLLAAGSSLLYGILIDIQLYGLTKWARFLSTGSAAHDPVNAFFQLFVNSAAFFLVALLGSRLAERLKEARREVEKQQRDIRKLRTLHREIIENIPSGIITFDLNGRIVSSNRSAQKILALGTEEARDISWRETPFQEIKELEEFFTMPTQTFSGLSRVIEFRRTDGRDMPIGMTLTPLTLPDGALGGLVGIFQDLTERRRMEARLRQADRLAAAGQLAAGLAHEIRNPLAAISGSAELMKEAGLVSPQLLDIVLRETDRLKLVTGQFLDFAKPMPHSEKRCDLIALAEQAVPLLEKSCESTHAVTCTCQGEEKKVIVMGDPDQLKQVVWNLGLNALQAMPTGGQLTFTVRRHTPEHGQGWAAIELTDTGHGMTPTEIERIFEPFYTTKSGGTGLGLAIAKKIIDNLGGRIEVISHEGKGSTFRVWLKAEGYSLPKE
jgi:two-component system sensor histidine kinase PilS (NtrC family)